MPKLSFQGQTFSTLNDEKVLDAFLRMGITVPFSCRNGVCHSCKQVATSGSIPAQAQKGLSSTEREQGFFLPCLCVPSEDMVIQSPSELKLFTTTLVQGKEFLTTDTYKLLLEPTLLTPTQRGQTINLRAHDGEVRRFTIINQPAEDYFLEVHIPCVANDSFSHWISVELSLNQERVSVKFCVLLQ